MKNRAYYFFLIFIPFIFFTSCNYHNIEEYFEEEQTELCDTTNISFHNDIFPIIADNCISCHNDHLSYGGRNYDTYEGIKIVAETGLLLNVIKHTGTIQMPQDADKLPECDINKIEAWINQGIKDN